MSDDFTKENQFQSPIAALRKFVRPPQIELEHCDLCSLGLKDEHQHLFEPTNRQVLCACDACAILFSAAKAELKYKRVPRRALFLPDFEMSDFQWNDLLIPIKMAFFFYSTPARKTLAMYPSPAGPVESLLEFETWREIENQNPLLRKMEADVEALLVNRIGADGEYFIAPIDECYKLVGLIRANWRGLSGGAEVWESVDEFFGNLRKKAITKLMDSG